MKQTLFLLFILVGFLSCTNEDSTLISSVDDSKVSYPYNFNRRSFEEVINIAEKSISILQSGETETRRQNNHRTLDLTYGVKAICAPTTRANGTDINNDTLLYIFNFKDDQGFTIISASRHTEPIIVIVEEGSFDPDVITGNPAFDTYMCMAKNYILVNDKKHTEDLLTSDTRASSNPIMCRPVYDTVFNKKVEPMINVKWGQEKMMGELCPNKAAGCVNTAIAQIMSYYKSPTLLNLSYLGNQSINIMLDWESMCSHIYVDTCLIHDAADLMISHLGRQLGHLSSTQYLDNKESPTTINHSREAFDALGYNYSSINNYTPLDIDASYTIANGLNVGRLVYMCGKNNLNSGHTWVIDGCYYVKAYYRLLATYDGITWVEFQNMGTYRTCLNHINWGWNGAQNGYFLGSVLDAYRCFSQDDPNNVLDSNNGSDDANYYNNVKYYFVWR